MKKKLTSQEFIDNFDNFHRVPYSGSVIIHPALPYNLIELTGKFVDKLKDDLTKKITMAHQGLDELSPTDMFAIMILEQAY